MKTVAALFSIMFCIVQLCFGLDFVAVTAGITSIEFTWDEVQDDYLEGYTIWWGEASRDYKEFLDISDVGQRVEFPVPINIEDITDYGYQNTGRTNAPEVVEEDGQNVLVLKGQNWVKIELKKYNPVATLEPNGEDFIFKGYELMALEDDIGYWVRRSSILEFDFKSTEEGDAHAIGFDDDNTSYNSSVTNGWAIKLFGKATNWKSKAYEQYKLEDGWKHYSIQLGFLENVLCEPEAECRTPFKYMTFIMDNRDATLKGRGNCYFKNIVLTHMAYIPNNWGTVKDLKEDTIYYFAVTAFDIDKVHSEYSNEVVVKTGVLSEILSPLQPKEGVIYNEDYGIHFFSVID